ncbi:MAG: repair protein RecN [Thermotogaceae bacterium]|jgi:DNA repair protein RecN (Recombination protein N)|nr:repair protein RecN [Thermotogaceae bacterium]
MLLKLQTKNYAFFEDLDITFSDRLNVITGESGSGKSLFVKALQTLMGEPQNTMKMNEDSMIQGYLVVGDTIRKSLREHGIKVDEELIVTVSFQNKRLIYRINGIMVPKEFLRNLSRDLFVFHTQGSQSKLFSNSFYMDLIDQFVDAQLLESYRKKFKTYFELLEKKKKYLNGVSNILKRKDYLSFQINEIETFSPSSEEEKTLNSKYSMMLNSKKIRESLAYALELIRTGDKSVYDILNDLKYMISSLNQEPLKPLVEKLNILIDGVEDWRYEAEKIFDEAEYSDEEFERLTQRLNGYQLLKKKYGSDVDSILKNLEDMRKELFELENMELELENIDEKLETLKIDLQELALKIREKRRKVIPTIERSIKKHLNDLKMKDAEIKFELNELNDFAMNGLDEIKLVASMNPGIPEAPIAKIASGGELSRIMLAIELAISERIGELSLIFDEVDSGIGQRIAEVVAKKLKEVSKKHQVLVVSHLPQIPLVADKHFVVQKASMENETRTFIKELNESERIVEITSMFGESFEDIKSKIEKFIRLN